jgi:hypothetical protein
MKKLNPANERIKRKYFAFLKEVKRHSEPTIHAAAKALNRFEVYSKFRDFKAFILSRPLLSSGILPSRRASAQARN